MTWIVRNWQLKLGAVALAVILYTGLVFTGSFTDARIGGVPIQRINQPSGAYVITQNLAPIEVHYRRAQEAAGTVAQDSFAATVDLSRYDMQRPGTPQSLPVAVSSLASGVTVLDASPDEVTVILDVLASKEVDVRVDHGAIPDGLELGTPTLSVTKVMARGPSAFVSQVALAEARVSVDASGIDYHNANVELRPIDASGALVQSVELTPSVATVDIPVEQTQTSKTVPVSVILDGAIGAGYAISQVSADPLTVTLRGTPAALAGVSEVTTEPVPVDGLAATRSFTANLVVPSGVQLAKDGPTSVSVRVAVEAVQGSRTFLVGVVCTGTAPGSTCLPQANQIAMTVSGSEPALAALKIDQITPVLDASGLAAGSHDVTPAVSLPDGITLVSFSPGKVTVVITAPTPTPTPSPGA